MITLMFVYVSVYKRSLVITYNGHLVESQWWCYELDPMLPGLSSGRSAIRWVGGSRTIPRHNHLQAPVDLVLAEALF